MKMKVAIFCPRAMLSRVKQLAVDEELEFMFFPYMQTKELLDQVEKAYVCDIYLFTEQIPYLLVKNKVVKNTTPCVCISLNEYMLLTTLSLLKQERKQSWDRISMDVCDETPVYNVLSELDLQDNDIYLLRMEEWMYHDDFSAIVEYHQSLWKQDKIDYVLTSHEKVEEKLKQKEIPAKKVHIPSLNIKLAIEEAKQIAKLQQYQLNTTQIVIGYIQLKATEARVQSFDSNEQLRHIVNEFAHQNNACMVINKHNRIMLFGTNSMLDHIKRHYRDFPLLHIIERHTQLPVAIGFGLGLDAKRAKENAQIALKACLASNESKCYLVNENQDTIGPIGITKTFDTSKLYQALIHKARLNNETSYNFIQFVTMRNNEPFSSHDFALHYKITKRSAERTINKLLAGKVIKITGEEKPYIRGRPRKLFSLNL